MKSDGFRKALAHTTKRCTFFREIRKRVKAILRAEILFVFIFYTTNCFGKQHYKGAIYERMEVVAGDRHPKTVRSDRKSWILLWILRRVALRYYGRHPKIKPRIVDTEMGYGMVGMLKQNLKSWILRCVTGWSAP